PTALARARRGHRGFVRIEVRRDGARRARDGPARKRIVRDRAAHEHESTHGPRGHQHRRRHGRRLAGGVLLARDDGALHDRHHDADPETPVPVARGRGRLDGARARGETTAAQKLAPVLKVDHFRAVIDLIRSEIEPAMQSAGFRRLDFQIDEEIFARQAGAIVPRYSADRAAAEQVVRKVRQLYPDWKFSLSEDLWGYTATWQCPGRPASL